MIKDLQRQLEESNVFNKPNGVQSNRLYGLLESQQKKMSDMKKEKAKFLAIIEKLHPQLAVGKKMHFLAITRG